MLSVIPGHMKDFLLSRIAKVKKYIKLNKIFCLFLAIVGISLVIHLSHRNDHFQEADSTLVYENIRSFPYSAMTYMSWSYAEAGSWFHISEDQARGIIENSIVSRIMQGALGDAFDERMREKIVTGIAANKPIGFYVRGLYILVVAKLADYIPYPLEMGLVLPFSSTYSFGPGVVYGLATAFSHDSYASFMSMATGVTIIIFHATVILLYMLLVRLSITPRAATIMSSVLLFAVTAYSYGYHLGSSVWNMFSGTLFLLLVVVYRKKYSEDVFLKRVAWSFGILVFFNYLLIFYYAALFVAYVYTSFDTLQGKNFIQKMVSVLKTQKPAIVLTALCTLLFFQSGQGNRATAASVYEVVQHTYYGILNFFSIYHDSRVLDMLQVAFFGILLSWGGYVWYQKRGSTQSVERIMSITLGALLVVYTLAVVGGVLGFAATRHMLFLVPAVYMVAAGAVNVLIKKYHVLWYVLFGCVLVGGLYGVHSRIQETTDIFNSIRLEGEPEVVLVNGYAYSLLYKDWGSDKKAVILPHDGLVANTLETGKTYWYVSQTNDFSSVARGWESRNIVTETLMESTYITDVRFPAYDPESYGFNRPNNAYIAKFTVISK